MKLLLATVCLAACTFSAGAQVIRIQPPPGILGSLFGEWDAMRAFTVGDAKPRVYLAIGMSQGFVTGSPGGRAFVFDASNGQLVRTLESPLRQQFGHYGHSVDVAERVESDELARMLAAAYLESVPGGPSADGRAHVQNPLTGATLHTLAPESQYSQSNFSLHGARFVPDLDGDGVDDVIVAAANQIPYGRVYVFSGATGERIHLLASPVNAMGEFGSAVVALSDGDGDEFGDFAVLDMREPWNDGSGFRGVIHLFSGATGTLRASARYRSPLWMNACGDIDRDGVTDFLALTYAQIPDYPDSAGTVRVFSGSDLSVLHTFVNPDPAANPSGIGGAIGGTPDLDHDGVPEILIGSFSYRSRPGPATDPSEGAVYIYSGRTFSLLRLLVQPTGLLNTAFGDGLTWVPDVNHDGVPEIAVAAPNEPIGPPPYQIRGAVYIILSCPADWDADGDATAADFFGFLDSFFALDQYADFNRDGLVNSQDFFDYLSAFFAGCE